MKTKRHAAALGMLVVLLIAGSGYVHLANASAQEQALAYGGSIEPLIICVRSSWTATFFWPMA